MWPLSDYASMTRSTERISRALSFCRAFLSHGIDSNAWLQSFKQDLHLVGQQYATVLSILFVGYTIMQAPA
jgi:hypothetical protein